MSNGRKNRNYKIVSSQEGMVSFRNTGNFNSVRIVYDHENLNANGTDYCVSWILDNFWATFISPQQKRNIFFKYLEVIVLQIAFSRDGENINPMLKTCSDLCYGNRPCVRICSKCADHHLDVMNDTGHCIKPTHNIRSTLFNMDDGNRLNGLFLVQSTSLNYMILIFFLPISSSTFHLRIKQWNENTEKR